MCIAIHWGQHNNSLTILCYVHCHSLSQNDAPLPTATTKKTMEGRLAIDEARTPARTATVHAHKWLSYQQMASFGVYQEGLDDLPQQRGTRESIIAWCGAIARMHITSPGPGGGGGGGGKSLSPVAAPPTCTTHSACSTSLEQQYGVVQCRSVCSSTVYSRSVECKNNYRLVRVHTSVEY